MQFAWAMLTFALAREKVTSDGFGVGAEAARIQEIAIAVERLKGYERASIDTQVPTATGRFVDLEIWLRPKRPSSGLDDVVIWVEVKYGAGLHGDQLQAYLRDIETRPAAHRLVVLLAPRGDLFDERPSQVPLVEWQAITRELNDGRFSDGLPAAERWILDEYTTYLWEEGLMDPDALTAAYTLTLMSASDAESALAGVCEHAEAALTASWGKPAEYSKPPRSKLNEPAFGLGYWASFDARPATETWQEGWFEWGNDDPYEWQYINADELRGSNAFYAGGGFFAKTNPYVVTENQQWVATLLSQGFTWCWFNNYYRLVRVKYPDELLSATSLEDQGKLLADWIDETFRILSQFPPPH